MPVAVTLRLDAEGEAVLARIGAALPGWVTPRLGYPPHITLLRGEDEAEPDFARAMAAAQVAAVDLAFAGYGIFPGPPAILFLAPVVTSALLALHAALAATLPADALHPHVRPGAWVPHATLAEGTVDAPAALAAWPMPGAGPVRARGVALELVRFPPPVVRARRDLPAG